MFAICKSGLNDIPRKFPGIPGISIMADWKPSQHPCRLAFTVPELLAVVAVIVIIISILLPAFGKARETARDSTCKINQRQLGLGFINFAAENKQRMPGVYAPPYSGAELHMRSWMGNEAWPGVTYEGSVVQYIGGAEMARKTYRCPSLPTGVLGSGIGSNGLFDYTGLLVFTGARRQNVPSASTWADPKNGVVKSAPTPLVVEEDPANFLNRGNVDPGHSNVDRLGTWHNGGGNYIAFDGHSQRLTPAGPLGPTTWDWQTKTPSGVMTGLSSHASGYAGWDAR